MKNCVLELWADSFHEGDWACKQIGVIAVAAGWSHKSSHAQGFIPIHTFKSSEIEITLTVYGSYKSWDPLPIPISDLLSWGKPDFILYDSTRKKIVFAVEETAAVPTGNQALQRCERAYGSARSKIPFWYLLSEYGTHKDKGVRRDSIWPTVMALKLTHRMQTPCVVLHYSDIENPENYSAGAGLASLFDALFRLVVNTAMDRPLLSEMSKPLHAQYRDMLEFLSSQWKNIVDFLPGADHLSDINALAAKFTAMATPNPKAKSPEPWPEDFLLWPTTTKLPKPIRAQQRTKPLIKHDPLCARFEYAVGAGKAYCLSDNAGSRPQPEDSLAEWIGAQEKLFNSSPALAPEAHFHMKLRDFPKSDSGNRHVTTAKNIVYLYDRWRDVRADIEHVYPRLKGKLDKTKDDVPALVYLSNSVKPGRIFGDPFTGQIAAYATAFGKLDPKQRLVLAYFPHQAHTQAISEGKATKNKGLTLMAELTDYLLFVGGVAVSLGPSEKSIKLL